ncbi:hypothetical protein [Burkholderia sp. 22PA0106]|uniref:hypothetical protein n=1 Tax=Burkholderia sp. 22PA0106 TaxID=3237371 RepID=UPI0039C41060
MFATLQAKVIASVMGFVLLVGAVSAGYAIYEHQAAQLVTVRAALATAQATADAAKKQAQGLAAAMDAQKSAQAAGQVRQAQASKNIAAAAAAAPQVASTAVPESYWQAIYGSPASEAK